MLASNLTWYASGYGTAVSLHTVFPKRVPDLPTAYLSLNYATSSNPHVNYGLHSGVNYG